jgi:hypothetical protein
MSWTTATTPAAAGEVAARVEAIDWAGVSTRLDADGWAMAERLLTGAECRALAGLYDDAARFRSRVVMARHGFGQGEYQYFAYPLPALVAELRTALYPRLAPIANRWHAALGIAARFPPAHAAFVERCHRAGQTRPTPLLLRYAAGDYNALHQDLYGEHVFPLQVTILLSSGRGCNHAPRWCRCGMATASSSPYTSARCGGRAAPTASPCGTA